jgi:tetratricopeptide (TPR) repeat protein
MGPRTPQAAAHRRRGGGRCGIDRGPFVPGINRKSPADADAKLFDLPVGSGQSASVLSPSPSAYLDIAKNYPNTSAAEYASLLGAEQLFLDGNYAESERAFSQHIIDYPDSALIAQAKMGVAACLEAEGKSSEALQKYQAIISAYASELNVSEPAKLTMARLYEQENRPDQALSFYGELARSKTPMIPGRRGPGTRRTFIGETSRIAKDRTKSGACAGNNPNESRREISRLRSRNNACRKVAEPGIEFAELPCWFRQRSGQEALAIG